MARLQVVASGIRDYFDRLLGTCLLYDTEREQYDRLVSKHPSVHMSEVYGAEHLLRLFGATAPGPSPAARQPLTAACPLPSSPPPAGAVRLEELLPQSEMNAEDIKQLVPKLKEILKCVRPQPADSGRAALLCAAPRPHADAATQVHQQRPRAAVHRQVRRAGRLAGCARLPGRGARIQCEGGGR